MVLTLLSAKLTIYITNSKKRLETILERKKKTELLAQSCGVVS